MVGVDGFAEATLPVEGFAAQEGFERDDRCRADHVEAIEAPFRSPQKELRELHGELIDERQDVIGRPLHANPVDTRVVGTIDVEHVGDDAHLGTRDHDASTDGEASIQAPGDGQGIGQLGRGLVADPRLPA